MSKFTLRKAVAIGAIALFVIPWLCWAGSLSTQQYLLFAGDTDSTEQITDWIPIKNAQRVKIRTWSTHLVGGANADTAKVDSIVSFIVQFSDSICCYVTGKGGNTQASAQDSFALADADFTADTATVGIGLQAAPISKALRGAVNGSGIITTIYPIQGGTATAADPDGFMPKALMRIRFTPKRRNTSAGSQSTQGLRTNGLRGMKMVATVYYANR
jgi:hypothetical protein